MAEVEIVQPRPSYDVVSDAEAYGSCRRHGKRLYRLEWTGRFGVGVSHTCLDGLRPTTGSTGPATSSLEQENRIR